MKHSDIIYIMGVRCIYHNGRLVVFNQRGKPAYGVLYGEPCVSMRVPVSLVPELKSKMAELAAKESELKRVLAENPLFTSPGFTADDLPSEYLLPRFREVISND